MRLNHMMTQQEFDSQVLARSEFEEYTNSLAEEIAPKLEIDSEPDDLGELYRVWHGSRLLGTFYQNLEGKWIAQLCNRDGQICCKTSDAAQLLIIAVSGLLVAQSVQQVA